MFIASIILCAATGPQVFNDRCIKLQDSLGPYQTEKSCRNRADQMEKDILGNDMLKSLFYNNLGKPESVVVKKICEPDTSMGIEV